MRASALTSLFVTLALGLVACGGAPEAAEGPKTPAATADPASRRAVAELLDGFHAAAARADETAYFACFADDGVFMGTDATERWDVPAFRAYAHPHFARGKAWSFRATARVVRVAESGDVAWFDEALETANLGPARGSGVVVRRGGAWKIAHYNLSLTVPNERFDDVRRAMWTPPPLRHDEPAESLTPNVPRDAAAIGKLGERLAAVAEEAFHTEKPPSLAVAFVSGGRAVMTRTFGVADVASSRAATPDTAYRIGSITKTFTAAALLALRDRGRLSLDDRLDRWLPEAAGLTYAPNDAQPVTLRALLSHASGLPRLGDFDYTRPDRDVTEADVLGALGRARATAPETRYLYSNFGMALGGLVVARAAKEPYREVVRRSFFVPLRMQHSGFAADEPGVAANLATGYLTRQARAAATPWRLGASEGAGGIYASVNDMATWVAFQLDAWPPRSTESRGTEALARASRREGHVMRFFDGLTAHGASDADGAAMRATASGVGYAWHVRQTCEFAQLVRHGGAIDGFTSEVVFAPDRDFGLVVLTNTAELSATRIADRLLDAVRKDLVAVPSRDAFPSPSLVAAVQRFTETMGTLDAAGYESLFASQFRDSVPFNVFAPMTKAMKDELGECKVAAAPDEIESPQRATFRLECARGTRLALAEVDRGRLGTLFLRKVGHRPSGPLTAAADAALALAAHWDDARAGRLFAPKLTLDRMRRALADARADVGTCRRAGPGDGDGDHYAAFPVVCGPRRLARELRVTLADDGRVSELLLRAKGSEPRCE